MLTVTIDQWEGISGADIQEQAVKKNAYRLRRPVTPQPPRVFRISFYWTTFHHYLEAWNRLCFQCSLVQFRTQQFCVSTFIAPSTQSWKQFLLILGFQGGEGVKGESLYSYICNKFNKKYASKTDSLNVQVWGKNNKKARSGSCYPWMPPSLDSIGQAGRKLFTLSKQIKKIK